MGHYRNHSDDSHHCKGPRMPAATHDLWAEQASKQKAKEMSGGNQPDFDCAEAERFALNGIERAHRSYSHLDKNCRDKKCGQRDQQMHRFITNMGWCASPEDQSPMRFVMPDCRAGSKLIPSDTDL
jgi:hypothetical protein